MQNLIPKGEWQECACGKQVVRYANGVKRDIVNLSGKEGGAHKCPPPPAPQITVETPQPALGSGPQ